MQVKQRLRINTIISALSMLAIVVMLLLTMYRVNRAFEAAKIADGIVTSTFERVTLGVDYLRTGNERSREQVFAKHRQIGELLKSAAEKFTDSEDKKTINELVKNHESTGIIFKAIVGNRKKSGPGARPDELSEEIEDRLLSQLNMRIYNTVLLGSKLQESGNATVSSALGLAGGGILFVLLFISAAIAINSWTMSLAITDRILRLRDGASVIGGGSLNHRLDVKGDDEFADLSEAFNAMTVKLRGSYHDLENEITVRRQAEEALRTAYDEIETRIRERTTELARMHETVTAERQRLYDVLETLPVYVILLDSDYRVPFANRYFRERFGESCGKRCYEYLFNRTEPCEICETYTVLKTSSPHHWEWLGPDGRNYDIHDYPFVDSDGSTMIMEMGIDITEQKQAQKALLELNKTQEQRIMERTAELQAANETLRASRVAALNIMDDAIAARRQADEVSAELRNEVAERKRAEEALKASEAKYRALFENMIDGFALHKIVVDDTGKPIDYIFLEANSAFERLTGLATGSIIGKRVTEVMPGIENDPANWIGAYGRTALTGNDIEFEQYAEPLGKWFAVSAFSPMKDHFATIFVDITERKRAEQAVKASEQKLRLFIEHAPASIAMFDKDMKYLSASLRWYTDYHIGSRDIIGLSHYEVFPDLSDAWKAIHRRCLAGSIEYKEADPWVRQDGTTDWIRWEIRPWYSGKDEIGGIIIFSENITELKEAEMQLQGLNKELEQRVAQRTRFYIVLANINEAIVRRKNRQSLFDEVCRIIVETGGFRLAWVGLVDSVSREVRPASSYGATGYLDGLRIVAADVPEGRGPTGQAIAEARHIINTDFEVDENMAPWRDRARAHGIRSSSAFPLKSGDEVIGALTIYADRPSFFTVEEVTLFLALSENISFALEAIENEQKRLKAVEEIRRSEAEVLDLYNNAPCGYHSVDGEGTIVRINDTELRWLGYSRDEVVGKKKIYEFYTTEGVSKFKQTYPEFVENGSTAELELDIVRKDGTAFPVLLNGTAIRDGKGNFVMSRSTMFDITERKESESRTKITNLLLKLFTQKFNRNEYLDAVCKLLHDWSGCRHVGIRIVNPSNSIPFEACFGYDQDFLKQESDLSLATDRCICPRIIAGNPELTDLQSMTPNGSFYSNDSLQFESGLSDNARSWYRGVCMKLGFRSLAVIPIRYRDKPIGALHLSDDQEGMFSQQKVEFLGQLAYIIGEAVFRFSIEDAQMRLASAVDSAADGVVVTEPSAGMIEYVNPAFEQITGYRKEEAVGRTLHILDSGKHDESFYREMRDVIKRDGVWQGRLYNKKRDGTIYLEDCTCSPVRDQSGKIINFVWVKRDVSDKVRLESIAESVNTMNNIGYIFSGVRHEIGNPINSAKMILSVLQYKLEKASKEAIKENIDRTLVEIGRVEHLLRNLKNFNLYEKPELQNLNLAQFMKEFTKLIAEDFEKKGILVRQEFSPDVDHAYVDPRALQQVLMNLVTNAADAVAGRDDPRIDITAKREAGLIHITVVDNGIGMTDKQLNDLFRPFYTSKQHGTGLGLVIVKKMLARMNCDIAITSVLHEGTMVDLLLPEGSYGEQK